MDKKALDRLRQLAGTQYAVKTPTPANKNMYQIRDMLRESVVTEKWKAPNEGEYFDDEENLSIRWIADDDGNLELEAYDQNENMVHLSNREISYYTDVIMSQLHDQANDYDSQEYDYRSGLANEGAEDRARYKADQEADKKKVTLKKAPWEKDDDVKEGAEDRARYKADQEADKKKVTLKKAPWEKDDDKEPKTEQQQMREWANSVYQQYEDRGHYQEQPEGETVDLSLRRYLNAQPQRVKVDEDHTAEGMLKEYKNFKKGKN